MCVCVCVCVRVQVQAVRRGMARVVPVPLLSMLQPNELQAFVLGRQDIDLSLLVSLLFSR